MHSRIIFSILVLLVLTISCKKETFPDNDDLKGLWLQIGSDYLDKESLHFDGLETLYYGTVVSRAIRIDTLVYRLDKNEERLYLSPLTPPGSIESSHKIRLNERKNELSIWDLHSSDSGEEKFKKQ